MRLVKRMLAPAGAKRVLEVLEESRAGIDGPAGSLMRERFEKAVLHHSRELAGHDRDLRGARTLGYQMLARLAAQLLEREGIERPINGYSVSEIEDHLREIFDRAQDNLVEAGAQDRETAKSQKAALRTGKFQPGRLK